MRLDATPTITSAYAEIRVVSWPGDVRTVRKDDDYIRQHSASG
jgi:hypothetical protein